MVRLFLQPGGDEENPRLGLRVEQGGDVLHQGELDPDTTRALGGLRHRFTEQAESKRPFPARVNDLATYGRQLFDAFFAPYWPLVQTPVGDAQHLIVHSGDADWLNLPWELTLPPGDGTSAGEAGDATPLGCDARWRLMRCPQDGLLVEMPPPTEGPLRILCLAAAPIDQVGLDYQREEDGMLRATQRLTSAQVYFSEAGDYDDMLALARRYEVHLIHLSGHGVLKAAESEGEPRRGVFCFESERGRTDERGADEIARDLSALPSLRGVFVSGCQSGIADVAGLCQGLVMAGLPAALGWAAKVGDDAATAFADAFYQAVVDGQDLPQAAARARDALRRNPKLQLDDGQASPLVDMTYALPRLFSRRPAGPVWDRHAKQTRTDLVQPALPPSLGHGIEGSPEGFVGRRRVCQRLIPSLREGETTVALITGMGGIGKSTLSSHIAFRLPAASSRPATGAGAFYLVALKADQPKGGTPK